MGICGARLKEIGEQRGWEHNGHPSLFDIVEHPGREIDKEAQFSGHLAQAGYMHRNFYHNDRSGTAIRSALNDVEKLVGELEVIRNLPPRPFVVQDNDDRVRLG